MNKKILVILGLVWSISGFSQKILNGYTAPQTVVDGNSVRMLPGFHAKSDDGSYSSTVIFRAKIGNPETETIPPSSTIGDTNTSSGQNYVYSRSYLVPITESNAYAPQVQSITYLDGLGRPKQNISIKSTVGGNDVVTKIEYDEFGRQVLDFLPMPQGGTTNSAFYESVSESVGAPLYGTGPYFAKKDLESSPLDRLNATTAPGDWNTSSKKVVFEYLANTDNEVFRFNTSTTWSSDAKSITETALSLASGNYYAPNTLYKNKVTDEDENVTYEYKNGQGQTVLVRKMLNASDSADTYYVYNEYDQLAYVLSPLASEVVKNNPAIDLSPGSTTLSQLCYQYQYDSRNRLAEKKLPGKGKEYMVYDKQDRLVMTQDTNLNSQGKWLFTKYDKFGRVAFTGMAAGGSRSTEQTGADGAGSNNVVRESGVQATINGIGLMYSQAGTYPNVSELLSINYYDTYPAYPDTPTFGEYDHYGQKFLTQVSAHSELNPNTEISTKGLPTASLVKTIDANTWTKSFTFYDQKGRPIYTQSNNHLGGYTLTASALDFAGTVQKSYTRHKRSSDNTTPEVIIGGRFVYDHQNRLLKHYHQVDSGAEVLLTDNTYDELGRLWNKKVGNDLQSMDFAYNIRGWLTGINKNDISQSSPYSLNNGKLFGYEIRYNNPKNESSAPKKYNGNISEVEWISQDEPLKRYGYQYDKLNRLLAGIYQDPESTVPETHANDELLTYDLNGNIKTLVRKALVFKTNVGVIDNLTYGYEGNRVINIDDESDNPSGYEGGAGWIPYDANGNMTAMPDKGINDIAYNYLNLPKQIEQADNTLKYDYRADGVKIKKKFTLVNVSGSKIINTEYLDGFQYSTPNTQPLRSALQETDAGTVNNATAGEMESFSAPEYLAIPDPGTPQNESLILSFFPTAEGYYDYENKLYIYQYKDHLGNVRVSFTKTSAGVVNIMDRNDYYPFGMNFLKNGDNNSYYDPTAIPYNYKYNGKELQETGMYDYGARMYMADIGRWGVVDPLAEKYRRHSTYNYTVNNPIRFIDPDGRGVEYFDKKAEKTAQALEKKLDKQIEKLNKGSDSDKTDKIAELNKSKSDISDMRNDKTTEYKFSDTNSKEAKALGLNGPSTLNTGKNSKGDATVTMFAENNTGSQVHEGRHGGQTARGELGANYGVSEEVSAYRAQYSFDGTLKYLDVNKTPTITETLNSIKNNVNPLQNTIKSINLINSTFVNSLVDPGFIPIYPPASILLTTWNAN